jgi:large subunit ribosomal protein L15
MLKLNDIQAPQGANREKKRRGRGPGSGQGKTGGRGHKGQKARSGGGVPPWFEGGQMPLNRRLPKRGFTNIFKKQFQLVNLDQLEGRFEAGQTVNGETLAEAGLVKYPTRPVKLLGRGELSKQLTIEVDRASQAAVKAVEAAGGSVTVKEQ